jgi:hypothetical protein
VSGSISIPIGIRIFLTITILFLPTVTGSTALILSILALLFGGGLTLFGLYFLYSWRIGSNLKKQRKVQ